MNLSRHHHAGGSSFCMTTTNAANNTAAASSSPFAAPKSPVSNLMNDGAWRGSSKDMTVSMETKTADVRKLQLLRVADHGMPARR